MADYYTHAVVQPFIPEDLITQEDKDKLEEYGFSSKYEEGSKSVYLYVEENYDGEEAEAYLQSIVQHSNGRLPYLAIKAGWDCSSMKPDGFGGHVVFITKDEINSDNTETILAGYIDAFKKKVSPEERVQIEEFENKYMCP
jgi:hypothetical protein